MKRRVTNHLPRKKAELFMARIIVLKLQFGTEEEGQNPLRSDGVYFLLTSS
jgi:hypothetical protein